MNMCGFLLSCKCKSQSSELRQFLTVQFVSPNSRLIDKGLALQFGVPISLKWNPEVENQPDF